MLQFFVYFKNEWLTILITLYFTFEKYCQSWACLKSSNYYFTGHRTHKKATGQRQDQHFLYHFSCQKLKFNFTGRVTTNNCSSRDRLRSRLKLKCNYHTATACIYKIYPSGHPCCPLISVLIVLLKVKKKLKTFCCGHPCGPVFKTDRNWS